MKLPKWLQRKKPKEATISAVVIRANGKREDLGVIAKGKIQMTPKAGGD
ncbi:MAG TPA: hypothetical protein VNN79_23020 [Actinomycetota bacterium]|nr:hypothetical protein [Actinomycetota bacterium]